MNERMDSVKESIFLSFMEEYLRAFEVFVREGK